MKYLLLSLSLWLCSYSACALVQNKSNPQIDTINQQTFYVVEASILEAVGITQTHLKSFPHQLDSHFGIASISQNIDEYSVMADQLISMLKTSKEIDNKGLWGKVGSMTGDPEEFMI